MIAFCGTALWRSDQQNLDQLLRINSWKKLTADPGWPHPLTDTVNLKKKSVMEITFLCSVYWLHDSICVRFGEAGLLTN